MDVVLPDDMASSDDNSVLYDLLHDQVRDFKEKYGIEIE